MAQAVPVDDLPKNLVPANDLPAPQEKSGFGDAAKAGVKQAAEAGGRLAGGWAGGEAGAALGALGGPAAPITVPLGAIIGGIGGYMGADYLGGKAGNMLPDWTGFSTQEREQERSDSPTATNVGELAVDVPTLGYGLARKAIPRIAKEVLGVPSRATEKIAQSFEKRGYKLEPKQLSADADYKSPGFAGNRIVNQTLANREASLATGMEAGEEGLDRSFLDKRLEDLGKEYDAIYAKEPNWKLDPKAVGDLRAIRDAEQAAVPGQVRPVVAAATKYIEAFDTARAGTAGIEVPAQELKRTISELKRIARTATDGNDRYAASKALSAFDGSLIRNHPGIAADLAKTNSQYRASLALSDLSDAGGIKGGNISLRRLGKMAPRLEGSALHDLAVGGRELNLSARWEPAGSSSGIPESILSPSKLGKALGTALGTRSQLARTVQRSFQGD